MRKLALLSSGVLISVIGSAVTGLALGVWVFRETGSAAQYGLTLLLNYLPGVLAAPLAGALVDRLDRRHLLIGSDAIQALATGVLALIATQGNLAPIHIYVAVALQSLVRTAQLPALSSSIVLLAPEKQVARANGMIVLAQAIGNTAGFAAGGLLLTAVGMWGVFALDATTFVINVVILLCIRIPRPVATTDEAVEDQGASLTTQILRGWRYIATHSSLVPLLVFVTVVNLGLAVADAMLTPLVLTFASAEALGLVIAAMAIGSILGGLALTTWGGPRSRIAALTGFGVPMGLCICLGATQQTIPAMIVAALGFMFCFTLVDGTSRNVVQTTVDPTVQGRVFSTLTMCSSAAMCIAYAVAGSIADHWAEPALAVGGSLAPTAGQLVGVGPGRGMAFILLIVGVVVVAIALAAAITPALRRLPPRAQSSPDPTPEAVQQS